MKLASRRDGRDGALIVVSKDTKKAVDATHIDYGDNSRFGAVEQKVAPIG